ncbi:LOW QUALITY PROTEIN: hypothetical protein U9M48_000639 [Paspalum notatum var. saurae]|uniref:O-methyltransferase ZRP4 n=1 Tax=Paspalum notatum var. saurae TaxID=547442 RepID=A0AAQ3PH32_PASNO
MDAAMSSEDLIPAQRELFNHLLCYVKSMALKCAVDLGIPTAIHLHGGSATLSEVVAGTRLPVSRKPYVRRLMNLLTISGIFTSSSSDAPAPGGGDHRSVPLTPASRLLLVDDDDEHSRSSKKLAGRSMATSVRFVVNPLLVNTFFDMHAWLKDDNAAAAAKPTLFEMAHGCSRHEMPRKNADDNALYNGAMVAASRMAMDIVLREVAGSKRRLWRRDHQLVGRGRQPWQGVGSHRCGFPHLKCTVLDLPHVVSQARSADDGTPVQFIAGDMFKFIPKADAVLLKWVLHCWGDDDCVKVLRNCKEAILPAAERGGKVIIIDAVMGACPHGDIASMETLALYDVYMMHMDGVERDERGWEKIILEAGFRRYKIVSLLGFQSVIEVYP